MKRTIVVGLIFVFVACTPSPPESPEGLAVASSTVESGNQTRPQTPISLTPETPPSSLDETSPPMKSPISGGPALNHTELLNQLLFSISTIGEGEEILAQIKEAGDTRFVAGLIDTLRYQRGLSGLSPQLGDTLNALTGQELPPDWFIWVEWAGQHPEIKSFVDYPAWKANLFAQIDPNFLRFVHADMRVAPDSRVEEIVWGGVRVDGIPALDNPTMVDPEEADYLVPHERVFGVSINGDTRAYPARFLDCHEMFNDIVGGEPVSLAY